MPEKDLGVQAGKLDYLSLLWGRSGWRSEQREISPGGRVVGEGRALESSACRGEVQSLSPTGAGGESRREVCLKTGSQFDSSAVQRKQTP